MSDRFEEALRRSLPEKTRPELDARILFSARRRISARRLRLGLSALAAAAAVIFAITLGRRAERDPDAARPPIASPALTADGTVVADPGADLDLSGLPQFIRLRHGGVRVPAGFGDVNIAVPGGAVVTHGAARVAVGDDGDLEMKNAAIKAGFGAAALAGATIVWVAVASGHADVDIAGVREVLSAPTERVFAFDPKGRAPAPERPESAPASSPAPAALRDPFADPKADWRGIVVDAVTRRPIEGAEAALVDWDPSDVFTQRHFARRMEDGRILSIHGKVPEKTLESLFFGPATGRTAAAAVAARTDAEGRFAMIAPREEFTALVVRAPGYLLAGWIRGDREFFQKDGAPPTIALVRARQIKIAIVEPDGRALRGIRPFSAGEIGRILAIGIRVPETENLWLSTTRIVPPGAAMDLEMPDAAEVAVDFEIEGFKPLRALMPLPPGDTWTLTLERLPGIEGTVVAEDGRPIDGASVKVESEDRFLTVRTRSHVAESRTTNDGFFRASTVGRTITVTVSAEGFADAVLRDVKPETRDLCVRLARVAAGGMRGRVMTSDGAPIPEQTIVVRRRDSADYFAATAKTDATGSYAFEGLKPGRYDVVLARAGNDELGEDHPADATKTVNLRQNAVEVLAGRETAGIDFILTTGGTVLGEVKDIERYSEHTTISLVKPHADGDYDLLATLTTGSDHTFRFVGIPAGTYAVVVGFGTTIRVVEVREGETTRVDLGARGARLTATVRRNGRAVADAAVIFGRVTPGGIDADNAKTDAAGRFSVGLDLPCDAIVRCVDPQTQSCTLIKVALGAGDQSIDIEWPKGTIEIDPPADLAPGAVLEVEAVRVGGVAIPAVRASLGAMSGANGAKRRFDGLADGEYRIRGRSPDDAFRRDVEVKNGVAVFREPR